MVCSISAGQCMKSHCRNGRSSPSMISSASPERIRKSSSGADRGFPSCVRGCSRHRGARRPARAPPLSIASKRLRATRSLQTLRHSGSDRCEALRGPRLLVVQREESGMLDDGRVAATLVMDSGAGTRTRSGHLAPGSTGASAFHDRRPGAAEVDRCSRPRRRRRRGSRRGLRLSGLRAPVRRPEQDGRRPARRSGPHLQ
jgi:hypothetical protein